MKLITSIYCILICLAGYSQIDCYPQVGDNFAPIREGVNLRLEPNLSAEIAFKSPNNGIYLTCVEDGFTNGFVKVEVSFYHATMEEYGVNRNFPSLFRDMKKHYSYNKSLASFYHEIKDTAKARRTYEQIKNDDWYLEMQEWNSTRDYDLASFDGFLAYWFRTSGSKDSADFILQNFERILYIHKSVIEKSGPVFSAFVDNRAVDYYIDQLEYLRKIHDLNLCKFRSKHVHTYLKIVVETLLKEKNYFEAIQQINYYEPYLKAEEEKYNIDSYKMRASYFDGNTKGALEIGRKLIKAFKNQKIINSKEDYYSDVDMSAVYGITISCLISLGLLQEGILLSEECLENEKLQYSQYIEFHAALLRGLGKADKACKFLNDEYMKGNENARELYLESCK